MAVNTSLSPGRMMNHFNESPSLPCRANRRPLRMRRRNLQVVGHAAQQCPRSQFPSPFPRPPQPCPHLQRRTPSAVCQHLSPTRHIVLPRSLISSIIVPIRLRPPTSPHPRRQSLSIAEPTRLPPSCLAQCPALSTSSPCPKSDEIAPIHQRMPPGRLSTVRNACLTFQLGPTRRTPFSSQPKRAG